jgi:hypothetical protein
MLPGGLAFGGELGDASGQPRHLFGKPAGFDIEALQLNHLFEVGVHRNFSLQRGQLFEGRKSRSLA